MTGGGGIGGSVFLFFDAGLSILLFSSNGTDKSGISSISLFFVGILSLANAFDALFFMSPWMFNAINTVLNSSGFFRL
jgi:hypothetical protein